MSIDSVTNISVVLQGQAISQAGFGTVLIMSGSWPAAGTASSKTIDSYGTLQEMVDAGWTTADAAYKAASAMVSQKLPPKKWKVGKGLAAPVRQESHFTVTSNDDGDYTAVVNGSSVTYTASGKSHAQIATELAALIDEADNGVEADATGTDVELTAEYGGIAFTVSLTTSNLGEFSTDVAAAGSAILLADIYAEDSDWYGLVSTVRHDWEIASLSTWAESNKRLYVAQTKTDSVKDNAYSADADDVGSVLKQNSLARTALLYHATDSEYADAGWIAGKLAVNPDLQSTTWAHYTIKSVSVDTLTTAQQDTLESKNVNYYVTLGGSGSTFKGVVADGTYIDNILASDWFRTRLIETHQARFTEYSNAGKKIPYTDAGIAIISADVRDVTERGIEAGHFMRRAESDTETVSPKYTFQTRSQVSAANVTNRVYEYQIEVVLAGAIHTLTATAYLPLS
tara:strand:- start:90 stop:1454 length:1365 start_codon:yes stop_codon:yes gene_type:complete